MEKTAGRGCESLEPQPLNLYPCETWSKLICGVNVPADVFCKQVRAAVTRSKARGRVVIIITDNLKTYTAQGSLPQFDRIGLVALNFCASQRSL